MLLERMKAEAIEQEVGMEKKARQQMELEHSITVAKLNQKVNTQATTTNGYISRDGQDKRARFHFHSQKSGINAGTLSNDPLVRIIREERIETTKTISALEVENKVIRPQLHKAQQPQMVDAKSREIRKLTVQLKATAKKNEKLSETNKAQARDLNILRKSTVAQQKLHFSIPRWCWCLGSGDEVTVF